MPRSALPPIVWNATCGHRNEVRSDHGGYPAKCKTCGASVWVPKRGAGRAPSAREAAGRFGPGRSVAARTRTADRPPRHAGFGDEADAEAMEEAARRDLARLQHTEAAVARMAEDLGRMFRRRQPAVPADDTMLEGVVIRPAVLPAKMSPAGPAGTRPIRAKALLRPTQPEPRYPAVAPVLFIACGGCRAEGRVTPAGKDIAASVQLDLAVDPWRLNLCGNCARQVVGMGVVTAMRPVRSDKRASGQVAKVARAVRVWCRSCGHEADPAQPRACPCGRAQWAGRAGAISRGAIPAAAPARQPNPTREISGRGRRPVSLPSGAAW